MDAYNAFDRIQEVFEAESLPDELVRDDSLRNALELDNVSFSWNTPPLGPEGEGGRDDGECEGRGKEIKKDRKGGGPKGHATDTIVDTTFGATTNSSLVSVPRGPERPNRLFKIQKTSLKIPRGCVVAIVGPVGCGKSSFLQGLIGEMRKESGTVKFGGSISYCPQTAWIQVSSFCNKFHATK